MRCGDHSPGALLCCMLLCVCASGCLAHHTGAMPGEPDLGAYVQLEDARVHYVDLGERDAPLVVLLHGFASSLNTWAGVAPALVESGHRVVALDLKGFGWTDRPRGDYSPKAQAKLVMALLDELGLADRSFGLVAHSWGSSVALALTLDNRERVERIALYDAWVYEEQLPTFFLWSRASSLGEVLVALFYTEQSELKMRSAFYDPTIISEELLAEVDDQLHRPGTRAAALAAIRGQRYMLVQDQYASITQPTLLLWGREDAVTPVWVGERLASELPDAKLEIYARCGHFPMLEASAASTTRLTAFLAAGLDAPTEDRAVVEERQVSDAPTEPAAPPVDAPEDDELPEQPPSPASDDEVEP